MFNVEMHKFSNERYFCTLKTWKFQTFLLKFEIIWTTIGLGNTFDIVIYNNDDSYSVSKAKSSFDHKIWEIIMVMFNLTMNWQTDGLTLIETIIE